MSLRSQFNQINKNNDYNYHDNSNLGISPDKFLIKEELTTTIPNTNERTRRRKKTL